jgi:hypothetical protein
MSYRALLFAFLERHLSPSGFKKRKKFLERRGEGAVVTVGIDHARGRWYVDIGVVLLALADRELASIPQADMSFRIDSLFESRHFELYPLCEEAAGSAALQTPELAAIFEDEIGPRLKALSNLETLKTAFADGLRNQGLVTWQAAEFLQVKG